MNNKEKVIKNNRLEMSIYIQSFIIVIGAVMACAFVQLANSYLHKNFKYFHWGFVYGIIAPFCVFIGIFNNYTLKKTYKYIKSLMDGIEQISNGDFNTQLNESEAGIFKDVYHNFNKMSLELKNVHMLRNDFINSYSHEFKTPITSINGFANLLLDEDVGEEEKNQYLQIIVAESKRLAELANSTIMLSKLDSQQIVTEKTIYSLDEQLRKNIIMISTNNDKNINFDIDLDEIEYYGNAETMQHLWLNLLSNSVKFTNENGYIYISLKEVNNKIIVTIKDSGIGINSDVVSRIFEKYYQAEPLDSRKGLGLGLSIVKRIIELCEGEIFVESKKNKGTKFIVTLPNKK